MRELSRNSGPLFSMSNLDRTVVNVRIVNYEVGKVYRAFSEPELLALWWGPEGFTNTFHHFDFREGGEWKFTMHAPHGKDFPNHISFLDIDPLKRIRLYHHGPVHPFVAVFLFESLDGRTRLSFSQEFELQDDYNKLKDFVLQANEENFDRLEEVLSNA